MGSMGKNGGFQLTTIHAADLYCGASGTTTGLVQTCEALGYKIDLVGVNHWEKAVLTSRANYPWAKHLLADVDSVNPLKVVPGGHLDILVASPECTHHSRAAGGRPKNEQSRAGAWVIFRWLDFLSVDRILVENVPDFLSWGPLDSEKHPIKERKGELFNAWLKNFGTYGYNVEFRVLNSADYGAPTSRRRLFVVATRGNIKPSWPAPTHSKDGVGLPKWRGAKEIIDFSDKGKSIFNRKKPLAPRTNERIKEGLRRFGGEQFLVLMEHGGKVQGVDVPLPTITTAKGGAFGVVSPKFLVCFHGGKGAEKRVQSVEQPLGTLDTSNRYGLAQSYLVEYYGNSAVRSLEEPLGTIPTHDKFGLVQPSIEGDITFRMLKKSELAAAMGFSKGYVFAGSNQDAVKQIGNAVVVPMAKALCFSLLKEKAEVAA